MPDESLSALEALRLLRTSIEARLQKNEDFRVLTALDRALADLSPSNLPKVQQPQAQAGATSNVQRTPAQAPAVKPPPGDVDTEQPGKNPSTVPSKNGFGAKIAELADTFQFATAR